METLCLLVQAIYKSFNRQKFINIQPNCRTIYELGQLEDFHTLC